MFGLGTLRAARAGEPADLRPHPPYEDDIVALRPQPRALGAGGRARPVAVRGPLPGRDVRPHALPADRRAAVPADARAARLLLVPARARGGGRATSMRCVTVRAHRRRARSAEWVVEPALVRLQDPRASPASTCSRPRRCASDAAAAGARARRGALPRRHARALPAAARPARTSTRAGPERRSPRSATARSTTRWPTRRCARRCSTRSRDGDASTPRTADAGVPPRRRPARRPRPRPVRPDRRRAVELVDRLRRRARPQGLPPRRAGRRTPSSSCCASSPTHGFEHIAPLRGWYEYDGRLVDATLGVAAGVRPRRPATAGSSRSTRSADGRASASSTSSRALGEVIGADAHRRSARTPATRRSRPRSRAPRRSRC